MTAYSGNIPRKPNVGGARFEADPINSTYRWEIYLTPGHPLNRVPLMDGYSKGMGFENTNKIVLLYKKLVNPVLPYLQRSDVIIVYEQNRALPKEYHKKLLELYPRDFKAYEWVAQDGFLVDYLERHYTDYVNTGTMPPIEDRRKNARQAVYMQELDHTKYQFNTIAELQAFCDRLTPKYSAQCMSGWFSRHADFQPELFEVDDRDNLLHVMHTAPTAEAAQAARNAYGNMLNKFPTNR